MFKTIPGTAIKLYIVWLGIALPILMLGFVLSVFISTIGTSGFAYGQVPPLKHQLFTFEISNELTEPDAIVTAQRSTLLIRYRTLRKWEFTLLDSSLNVRTVAHVEVPSGFVLSQTGSDESEGAIWLLLQTEDNSGASLFFKITISNGEIIGSRLDLPIPLAVDQLTVALDGLYLKGTYNYGISLIYCDPERQTAHVLPYGPEINRKLLGTRLLPISKQFAVISKAVKTAGRNPTLRRYWQGQPVYPDMNLPALPGQDYLNAFPIEAGQFQIGNVGSDDKIQFLAAHTLLKKSYMQGPVFIGADGFTKSWNFKDSLAFYYDTKEGHEGQAEQKWLKKRMQPYGRLRHKYLFHVPESDASGTSWLCERYTLRTRNTGPMIGQYGRLDPGSDYTEYETVAAVRMRFDTEGNLVHLFTIPLDGQLSDALVQRVVSLPYYPLLILKSNSVFAYVKDTLNQKQLNWIKVPLNQLGLSDARNLKIEHFYKEGTNAVFWGTYRKDKKIFFIGRIGAVD
jgi:hypothetical protein